MRLGGNPVLHRFSTRVSDQELTITFRGSSGSHLYILEVTLMNGYDMYLVSEVILTVLLSLLSLSVQGAVIVSFLLFFYHFFLSFFFTFPMNDAVTRVILRL